LTGTIGLKSLNGISMIKKKNRKEEEFENGRRKV